MKLNDVKRLAKILMPRNVRLIDECKTLHEIEMLAHSQEGTLPGERPMTLRLIEAGMNKIGVIKAVREITSLGLKEAKDLTDQATPAYPSVILKDAEPTRAKAARTLLEQAGGKTELRQ